MIGKNILYYRKEFNMSQADLSHVMGCTRQTICNWENGIALPSLKDICILCKLFNVDPNSLIGDIDENIGGKRKIG